MKEYYKDKERFEKSINYIKSIDFSKFSQKEIVDKIDKIIDFWKNANDVKYLIGSSKLDEIVGKFYKDKE